MAAPAPRALDGSAANASLNRVGEEPRAAARVVRLSSAAFPEGAAQWARQALNRETDVKASGEVESELPVPRARSAQVPEEPCESVLEMVWGAVEASRV